MLVIGAQDGVATSLDPRPVDGTELPPVHQRRPLRAEGHEAHPEAALRQGDPHADGAARLQEVRVLRHQQQGRHLPGNAVLSLSNRGFRARTPLVHVQIRQRAQRVLRQVRLGLEPAPARPLRAVDGVRVLLCPGRQDH